MAKSKEAKVSIDRRNTDRRSAGDRRVEDVPVAEERRKSDRRKVQRRRQIDPTTCERDYSADEIEFMQAIDAYKRANGRMFPTCSEILEVIRSLGYVRISDETEADEEIDSTDADPEAFNETEDLDLAEDELAEDE